MKKIISAIIVFALSLSIFTGCNSKKDDVTVRVGSLMGPTTIGLLNLMNDVSNGESSGNYDFTMATQPDEIAAGINNGSLDIALVPANLASVLYNKTEGAISVININTLGVIYCVSADDSINSITDLSGKSVITTGQGSTPEYALNYLLSMNGIEDCDVTFMTDGTEVIAALEEDPTQIAILPQPAATAAQVRIEGVTSRFSFTEEWDAVTSDSRLVTGVTIVRNEFLADHPDAVKAFLDDHKASAEKANSDIEGTAALVVEQGIVAAAPIAMRAIPQCNIVCITGEDMKAALSGYLTTLFEQNPQAVGGALPADDFYYLG